MSKRLSLSLACGDYEIVRALKEGSVKADGIDLTVLTDMDSATRHWRMLRGREFDVCELSFSSYIMARYRKYSLTALPVFLHRRFRHGFIFVNSNAGIVSPLDLIGKKVGVKTFQATAILWMRGILEHDYGVPHKKLHWVTELDEDIEFSPSEDLQFSRAPRHKGVDMMLVEGELAAVLHPDLIKPFLEGDPRVKRLFDDPKSLEIDYFKRTGIFPIMHVTAIKQEIVDKHPWVPINLMKAFEAAKRIAYHRLRNPRIIPLAWFRNYQEEELALLGDDPWIYGLGEANRKNLETVIQYSFEQGLIGRPIPVDELFAGTSLGRGRGEVYRI
jgi:4,5-dihydroxyphthalate decarboxylase